MNVILYYRIDLTNMNALKTLFLSLVKPYLKYRSII